MSGAHDPTGSDTVVFRPRMARYAAYIVGGLVLVASVIAAFVFSFGNQGLFVVFGLAVFWFCYREATVKVIARPHELVVRNLMSTRRLEWAEVIGISFPMGDPWAHLDLADGDTLATMALQRTDGERGIADARRLARFIHDRGEAPEAPERF